MVSTYCNPNKEKLKLLNNIVYAGLGLVNGFNILGIDEWF